MEADCSALARNWQTSNESWFQLAEKTHLVRSRWAELKYDRILVVWEIELWPRNVQKSDSCISCLKSWLVSTAEDSSSWPCILVHLLHIIARRLYCYFLASFPLFPWPSIFTLPYTNKAVSIILCWYSWGITTEVTAITGCYSVPYTSRVEMEDTGDCSGSPELSRRTVLNILLLLISMLLVISGFCLLEPFFPNEARKKGLADTHIAIVFTSYQVAVLVISPTYGMLVSLCVIPTCRSLSA